MFLPPRYFPRCRILVLPIISTLYTQLTTIDEALGLRTLAALLDGDLDCATEVTGATCCGYRFVFLYRLGLLMPSVTARPEVHG